MAQVVAISSGKGGTGKTTLCAGVACALAELGQRVLCIDADIGLRNLDIALGMAELPILSFTDVYHGVYPLSRAAKHPAFPNLSLLTAPIRENPEHISLSAFGHMLWKVRQEYDWCLIDAPAGLGMGFQLATKFADQVLVVSTPDPASLRDVSRVVDLLALQHMTELRLAGNRVDGRMFSRMHLTVDDMMDDVGLPLIGIVPEDPNVILAAAENTALLSKTKKGAALACRNIASRLAGKRTPLMKLHR